MEVPYSIAQKKNINVVGGSLFILDHKNNKKIKDFPGQIFHQSRLYRYVEYQHDGGFYRFIYSRQFILKNDLFFPNLTRMQDPVFFVQALIKAGYFYAITDYVYAYRKNHKKINWTPQLVIDKLKAIEIILKISRSKHLPHLHYLMVENFYNFSRLNLHKLGSLKNKISIFWSILRQIDFSLLKEKWNQDRFEYNYIRFFILFFKCVIS